MEAWELLWKIVLLVGLSTFAIMAVWVTIAGFRDIRVMLRRIDEQHKEKP